MTESHDDDLLKYLRIISKRKALIIALTFLCLFAAKIITDQITPVYEASAELLVYQSSAVAPTDRPLGESYQAVLMSEKLTNTFSEMLKERGIARRVIRELGLTISPENLIKNISAQPVKDTQLIQISVRDTDPDRARRIVNALGDIFPRVIKELGLPDVALSTNIKLVEPAAKPVEPIAPKPLLNEIIALLFGLTISISLAFMLEWLDVTVKSAEDVESLTGLASLGKIPIASNKNLMIGKNPQSRVSEAYRSLRTNIQYLNFDQSARVITVTSPAAEDGKTVVAVNLGTVLAQAGSKVLVIDCDLRRPRIHTMLNLSNEVGISSILAGNADALGAIQNGGVDRLSVLTSGPIPPNPADLLHSSRTDLLIKGARDAFDYIIIDSPPVLAVTDAAILGSKTDGVILASIYGKTRKEGLAAAKAILAKTKARVLGFVINGVRPSSDEYGYDYSSKTSADSATRKRSNISTFAITMLVVAIAILMFLTLRTML